MISVSRKVSGLIISEGHPVVSSYGNSFDGTNMTGEVPIC